MFIKLVVTVIPPKYFKMQVKYKYMKYYIFEAVSIKEREDCGLRTADCGLRTADCRLQTTDWI